MFYERYPSMIPCKSQIDSAFELLKDTFSRKNRLYLCGNGGSCADCAHIVGELVKGFCSKRPIGNPALDSRLQGGLPAFDLTAQAGLISAFCNDVSAELIYAQQVVAYGQPGDALFCLSTSGNSKNCVEAAKAAKALGMRIISVTGSRESALSAISDVCVRLPETETYKVQELTLPLYHELCLRLEAHFFK